MGLDALILVFWYWVLSQPVHSPLSPSPRSSSVPLHFLPLDYHLHIWACCYFSRQSWFQLVTWFQPDILHDVLCIEVKQGDNIQPWCILFSIWNQSVVPYKVLTVASWPAYRFLRSQVRWSGTPISKNFPQFVVIHTVKGFSIVNEIEVDFFFKFPCFLHDPVIICNLISCSSAFSKPSLELLSSCTDEA